MSRPGARPPPSWVAGLAASATGPTTGRVPPEMAELVTGFKAEHKHVFLTKLDDSLTVIYRVLTWREFLELESHGRADPLANSELVIRTALLWPTMLHPSISAGGYERLSDQILSSSGFGPVEALHEGREWGRNELTTGPEHTIVGFICSAFPAYKPEEIYGLKFLTLMIRLAQAEQVLGRPAPIFEGDILPRPEEMQAPGPPRPPRPPRGSPHREPMMTTNRKFETPPLPDPMSKEEIFANASDGIPDFEADNRAMR